MYPLVVVTGLFGFVLKSCDSSYDVYRPSSRLYASNFHNIGEFVQPLWGLPLLVYNVFYDRLLYYIRATKIRLLGRYNKRILLKCHSRHNDW